MNLLQMSFTGSIFIMLIFLLRLLAVNRLPKSTFLVLWGIAIIRLLIPFSIPSAFSVYSLFNRNAALQGALNDTPIARLLPLSNGTPSTVGSMATPQSMGAISFEHIIYFLGVALCLLIFATAYYCCMKKLRHSRPIRNSYISEWVKTHKIKRKIRFEQCDNISSPLTYGIFSPIILLPKNTDFDNCQELNYILLHEYLHIRRFDCLIKIVAVVTVCIHWFNPLVWLMYFFLNRDMELSCDEFVVRKNGKTARASYARLLIAMEERRSVPLAMFSEFSINVSEERITAIMKTKPFTVVSMVTASILILTLCAGFMTSDYGVKIDVGQPQTANVSVPNVDVPSINEKAVATASEWVTRKKWIAGKALYLVCICAIYYLIVYAAGALFIAENAYGGNLWSEPLYIIANDTTSALSLSSNVYFPYAYILNNLTPYLAAFLIYLLSVSYATLMSLLVFWLNLKISRILSYAAVMLVHIVSYTLTALSATPSRINLSLFSNSLLMFHNIGAGSDERYNSIQQTVIIYGVIIGLLVLMILHAIKRYDFRITVGGKQ